MSTPKPSAKGKKQTPASNQKSILGFFQRKSDASNANATQEPKSSPTPLPAHSASKPAAKKSSPNALTPAPSSDPVAPSSPLRSESPIASKNKENGLPSPCSSPSLGADPRPEGPNDQNKDSPSRKVKEASPSPCFVLTTPSPRSRSTTQNQMPAATTTTMSSSPSPPMDPTSALSSAERLLPWTTQIATSSALML